MHVSFQTDQIGKKNGKEIKTKTIENSLPLWSFILQYKKTTLTYFEEYNICCLYLVCLV